MGRGSLAQALVIAALLVFVFLDMSHFGITLVERAAYILVVLAAALAVTIAFRTGVLTRRVWLIAGAWLLFACVWMFPTIAQHYLYPYYVAGDFLSMILPLMLLLVACSANEALPPKGMAVMVVGLALGMSLAPLIGADGNRYEPPPTLLVAGIWWGVHRARSISCRALLLAAALVTGLVIVGSGQRTALTIWVFCAIAVVAISLQSWKFRVILMLAAAVSVSVLVASPMGERVLDLAASHRVTGIARGETDDSLMARWQEAEDVVSTFGREASWANYLFGFGHGATYQPKTSFLSRNITRDGRVHNIHIGPLMVAFRYGIVALVAYVGLALLAARQWLGSANRQHSTNDLNAGWGFLVTAYWIEGLMFNVIVDPLFSFAVAGLLSGVLARSTRGRALSDPHRTARPVELPLAGRQVFRLGTET